MNSAVERTLDVLELLAMRPEGMSVGDVANALDLPPSGTHRLLGQLVRAGYVTQERAHANYGLTMKMAALGLGFLRRSGVGDVAQPELDALARRSGELIRMAVADAGQLIFVAVAQGATSGLRYDPEEDQGVSVHLASSASGIAWLSTMCDEHALKVIAEQGLRTPTSGPGAFATPGAFLETLAEVRARGYSLLLEVYCAGMNTMAAPIFHPQTRAAIGTVSISGPSSRLTQAQMLAIGPDLLQASGELAAAAEASAFFARGKPKP